MSSIQPKTLTARTGQPFTIRTAQPEDAAAMLAYIRAVAGETEFFVLQPDEFPETKARERNWIQDHLDHPGQIVLLAEATGSIIGNVSFENGPHRRIAHRGSLGIAVVKERRGQRVGTALLESLLEWATANPLIEKICLEVFATNKTAIRLYTKLGFVEEGLRLKDIKRGPGQYVDTLAMGRFVK
ncbi:MAG: GNAT family protein [Thermoguttaceae bacterium]|jgi:RimJ/RimL family protein N-acetyltransferase